MNYLNECVAKETAMGIVERNPTVEENLDHRISVLKAELKRLEDSKESLKPILSMRIRDIRDAMSY